jgi:hypothetical protein
VWRCVHARASDGAEQRRAVVKNDPPGRAGARSGRAREWIVVTRGAPAICAAAEPRERAATVWETASTTASARILAPRLPRGWQCHAEAGSRRTRSQRRSNAHCAHESAKKRRRRTPAIQKKQVFTQHATPCSKLFEQHTLTSSSNQVQIVGADRGADSGRRGEKTARKAGMTDELKFSGVTLLRSLTKMKNYKGRSVKWATRVPNAGHLVCPAKTTIDGLVLEAYSSG